MQGGATMTRLFERPPRIEALLALHCHSGAVGPGMIRRLPAPFAAIVIDVGSRQQWRPAGASAWLPYPRVALHGLMTCWSEARFEAGRQNCLMALLQPWAVGPFLGASASDAVNRVIDLERVLPGWSAALLRELARADAPEDLLGKLEERVAARLKREPVDGQILDFLEASRGSAGQLRLGDYARSVGRPQRRLRCLVRESLGVAPKQWCILSRFSANLLRLHPRPWERAPPVEPDYFDQAHEIHEFRRLAGITPGAYRREKLAGDRRVYAAG